MRTATVRPAKNQISLGICEDSDQTRRMPRLISILTGRTTILLVLSCRCSFHDLLVVFSEHIQVYSQCWTGSSVMFTLNVGHGVQSSLLSVLEREFSHVYSQCWTGSSVILALV